MTFFGQMAVACCLVLAACASSAPTRLFLLASPAHSDGQPAAAGRPVQLQTVLVPDYLDTTDILMRAGPHEVIASRTGRWGERLSQGITHALQAGLAARLPNDRLTLSPPANSSALQLLVTVDALDVWPDGHCVLTAHWTILRRVIDANGREGHGWFAGQPAVGKDDDARVAAIAGALDQLSAKIAAALQGAGEVRSEANGISAGRSASMAPAMAVGASCSGLRAMSAKLRPWPNHVPTTFLRNGSGAGCDSSYTD